jgi:hypothetical protein
MLKQLKEMAAMAMFAEAQQRVLPAGAAPISRGIQMPPKQYAKRKKKMRMQKRSRKRNRA